MTTYLTNNGITVGFSMIIDRLCHISQEVPWSDLFQAHVNTFPGNLYQSPFLLRHVTKHKHTGGIGEISLVYCRYIYIYNITILQNSLFTGDSMTHHLIDGSAHTLRKAVIVKRCGNASHLLGHIINQFIDLFRTHAHMDLSCNLIQNRYIDPAALSNSFYLLRRLNDIMIRHDMTFQGIAFYFFIHCHMACFIFPAAATPAGIISSQFHLCQYPSSICLPSRRIDTSPHTHLLYRNLSANTSRSTAHRAKLLRQIQAGYSTIPSSLSTSYNPRPPWQALHKTPVHDTPSEYFLCMPAVPVSIPPWHPHPDDW